MTSYRFLKMALMLVLLMAEPAAYAAALVSYSFDSGYKLDHSSLDSSVSAGPIFVSTASNYTPLPSSGSGQLELTNWKTGGYASDHYFEFIVGPAMPSAEVSYGSLQFWGGKSSSSGDAKVRVEYDAGTGFVSLGDNALSHSGQSFVLELPKVLWGTVSPVTFRFSGWTDKNHNLLFDNISVSGVPAPGAAVLLVAGLGLEALRRRRRKVAAQTIPTAS